MKQGKGDEHNRYSFTSPQEELDTCFHNFQGCMPTTLMIMLEMDRVGIEGSADIFWGRRGGGGLVRLGIGWEFRKGRDLIYELPSC